MPGPIRLSLMGDVMLGRGIDQILAHSCDPTLHEADGSSAKDYVVIAEAQNGALPPKEERGVGYVWGHALEVLDELKPDVRIINLETAVTTSDANWIRKLVLYRMHPKNIDVLKIAKIDCCSLANNHILDWGNPGLIETMKTLKKAKIEHTGAGKTLADAQKPATVSVPDKGRVIIFAGGHVSAGVLPAWQAADNKPGVNLVSAHAGLKALDELKEQVDAIRQEGDIMVLSMHWGRNWDFSIDQFQKSFAHSVIDEAGIDIVHGHSSHHVKGMEVYKGKLIIYGCGDFLNDYEGVGSRENYRGDLALMYLVDVDSETGKLIGCQMVPSQTKQLRANKPIAKDVEWLKETLDRECGKLGTSIKLEGEHLHLQWPGEEAE